MKKTEVVGYKHFKYKREDDYFSNLIPLLEKLYADIPSLETEINLREDNFFHLMSNAIRIDRHYLIENILRQINRHLNSDFKIRIFLYQSDKFETYCTPRNIISEGKEQKELIILVSQHFLNSLGEYERASIISHELAHGIYSHVEIPSELLLKKKIDVNYDHDFKNYLLKWSFCREVTADIFSLIASDFNHQIVSRSLIKHTTGLNDVHGDDMIKMALEQYDEIANAAYQEDVATHPLMPLRIKVIYEVMNTNLAKSFGKEISKKVLVEYQNEFNELIDNCVEKIYPEIVSKTNGIDLKTQYLMTLAVVLADFKVKQKEIEHISRIVKNDEQYQKLFEEVLLQTKNLKTQQQYSELANKLIDESVIHAKKMGYSKHDLIPFLRYLIVISACDGDVDLRELEHIQKFAKNFDFVRTDLILILSSLKLV